MSDSPNSKKIILFFVLFLVVAGVATLTTLKILRDKETIESKQQQIEALGKSIENEKSKIRFLEKSLAEANKELAGLMAEKKALQDNLSTSHQLHETLISENQLLKTGLTESQTNFVELTEKNKEAEKRLAEAEKKLADMKASAEKVYEPIAPLPKRNENTTKPAAKENEKKPANGTSPTPTPAPSKS